MNPAVMPRAMAKLLAVLSIAFFWLLPFSPFVAIGAVSMTSKHTGWVRRLAMTGALMCIAHTLVLALVVTRLVIRVGF